MKLNISSTFVEYSFELIKKSMEIIHEVETTIQEPQRMVQEDNHTVDIAITNQVEFYDFAMVSKASVTNRCNYTVRLGLNHVSLHTRSLLHHVNNTVLTVETVFDPGGGVEPLPVAMVCVAITLIFAPMSTFCFPVVLAADEFVVTVFDPGGNHNRT
jgi:hypothetical protein